MAKLTKNRKLALQKVEANKAYKLLDEQLFKEISIPNLMLPKLRCTFGCESKKGQSNGTWCCYLPASTGSR